MIDTHVLIWFGETSPELPKSIRTLIEYVNYRIFVSHSAIWEMTIKMAIGKLKVSYTLAQWETMLRQNSFSLLPSSFRHFEQLQLLPFYHNDPFDRLMIAQAIAEDFTIITRDPKFQAYSVKLEFF